VLDELNCACVFYLLKRINIDLFRSKTNIKDLFTGRACATRRTSVTRFEKALSSCKKGSFKAGLRGWAGLENTKAPPGVMPGGAFFVSSSFL
jgi:hypothetical protein